MRKYLLSFHKRHIDRELITGPYIDHIRQEVKAITLKCRQRKLKKFSECKEIMWRTRSLRKRSQEATEESL